MKKQNFYILMTVFMFTVTNLFLYSGMVVLMPTKNNTLMLALISFIGYIGTLLYFDLYIKEKQRLTEEV